MKAAIFLLLCLLLAGRGFGTEPEGLSGTSMRLLLCIWVSLLLTGVWVSGDPDACKLANDLAKQVENMKESESNMELKCRAMKANVDCHQTRYNNAASNKQEEFRKNLDESRATYKAKCSAPSPTPSPAPNPDGATSLIALATPPLAAILLTGAAIILGFRAPF